MIDNYGFECKFLTEYLKETAFRNKLKKKLALAFKQVHGHNDYKQALDIEKNAFKSFESKDEYSVKHASFIGTWSEHFLKIAIKEFNKPEFHDLNKWIFPKLSFEPDYWYVAEPPTDNGWYVCKSVFETRKHRQKKDGSNFSESLEGQGFLTHKLSLFQEVIDHFKNNVTPYMKDLMCWDEFRDKHDRSQNICTITNWEMDFFDLSKEEVVEIKFSIEEFNAEWLWQTLLYVFVIHHYYALKCNNLKLINTRKGIVYTTTLKKLFGENGDMKFLEICKTSIMDCNNKKICEYVRQIHILKNRGFTAIAVNKKLFQPRNTQESLEKLEFIMLFWRCDEKFIDSDYDIMDKWKENLHRFNIKFWGFI